MVNSVELMQLCRLCLVKDEVNIPIFDNETDVQQIFLKISTCLPVKVTQDDNLPKKICNDCSYKLDLCYQFWNTSANSEKQLVTWLNEVGLSQETLNEAKLQKTESNSTPGLVLKQETIEPESESSHEVVNNVSTESQEYILQQQQLPYQTPAFPFTDDNFVSGESANAGASKTHTNNKRESTLKRKRQAVATVTQPDSDDDVDEDIDDPTETKVAKTEETSDDDRDDDGLNDEESTEFAGVPSTSTDNEQPGPSGIGKNVVDAPAVCNLPEAITFSHDSNRKTRKRNSKCRKTNTSNKRSLLSTKGEKKSDSEEHLQFDASREAVVKDQQESNKIYTCRFCRNVYNDKTSYRFHMNQEEKVYFCHQCGNGEKLTKQELLEHCKMHGIDYKKKAKFFRKAQAKNPRPRAQLQLFLCEICSLEFNAKPDLDAHYEAEHKNHYRCEVCQAGSNSLVDYIFHMQTHNEDKSLKCPLCTFSTCSRYVIKGHLASVHEQFRKHKCKICGKRFSVFSHFEEHKNFHTGEKPFQCDACGKKFMYSRYLRSHVALMHTECSENELKCPICDQTFLAAGALIEHRRRKHSKFVHVCEVCGKTFRERLGLAAHAKIHSEIKSYACSVCKRRFSRRSYLTQHERIHTGEKPHVCPHCGKGFTQRSSMVIHARGHTGERPYVCQLCDKRFTSGNRLTTHRKNCKGSPTPNN
ncbi:zinc finger protein 2 isoform X7 [Agrilus planipennis]|uniref:Zinc finger protein 2 isoform X7 n=1 Tax=Agrilus planipennis TaxID=224129 RepID=A0A1W4XRB7_AGRPL|nr:zinc finger protein 2 isoform X7 [Agrilus planipennis]